MPNVKAKKAPQRRKVQFTFDCEKAAEVAVVGDFNNWDPKAHPMKKDGNGKWNKTMLLTPGKYEYKFLVDGVWAEDPACFEKCPNDFGTFNNVLELRGK